MQRPIVSAFVNPAMLKDGPLWVRTVTPRPPTGIGESSAVYHLWLGSYNCATAQTFNFETGPSQRYGGGRRAAVGAGCVLGSFQINPAPLAKLRRGLAVPARPP